MLVQAVDRADVGMVQRGENLRLAFEARHSPGVLGEGRRQHLQRDVAAELHVGSPIDLAHSAGADLLGNLVVSEGLADQVARLPLAIKSERSVAGPDRGVSMLNVRPRTDDSTRSRPDLQPLKDPWPLSDQRNLGSVSRHLIITIRLVACPDGVCSV